MRLVEALDLSWHGIREGDEMEVTISEVARDGRGIARVDGCIIFVTGAVRGEKVRVRITSVSARHVHALALKKAGPN